MKRTRALFTMLILTMLLLFSVSGWARQPEDGVYYKRNAEGKVTAKMYVLTLSGKGIQLPRQRPMNSSAGAPYIALEACDDNGTVTEALATVYSWKTPNAGAGETGIRLTGENLRNSLERFKKFTPERFSTSFGQQVEFSFLDEGEAHAYHCSPALDGTYVRYDNVYDGYPLILFLYAYESAFNAGSFRDKNSHSFTYSLGEYETTQYFGDYYCLNVWDPEDPREVMAEKGLHIVMENWRQHDYRFPFVKDDYHGDPSWVGITWSTFTGSAMPSTNALYLHRYMTVFEPEMLQDPDTFIRMTDFFSGEGPDAVTTNVMAVLLEKNGELMQLGKADISDRGGQIRFRKMMGRASIKGDGVRIRALPNTDSAVLGEKDDGYPLTVLGFVPQTGVPYAAATWAKVKLDDGKVGYVSGQFIRGIDTPYN